MNIIISKLDLPCDIKPIINSYCYNEQGFNTNDLICIEKEKQKKKTKFMKLRHALELREWYYYNVAVCWLRPNGAGVYGTKNPNSIYGGGTLAESKYLRGIYKLDVRGDSEFHTKFNEYIKQGIREGDLRRQLDF